MIEHITLELRPRLQICNAFIQLHKVSSTKVRVKLLEESIEVTIGNSAITFLTKFVKFVPNSVSSLNIINNWVCFRIQIESNTAFGSFKTQLIKNSILNINFLNVPLNSGQLLDVNKYNIICSCCKNILAENICFERILPMPDTDYDPSEWFCCKHNHDTTMQTLIPSESDIFYGNLFFIVHSSLFHNSLKRNENTVVCSRCLQHVGKFHTRDSLKLWSCAVDYHLTNNSEIKNATNPLNDFLIAIKTSMTGMLGEEIVLQSFIGKDIHSLVLKPMDWHLNLMVEPKTFSKDNVITMQRIPVVKVLYKYEAREDTTSTINRTYCEVSLLVIRTGLEHLLMSTKRYPELYRAASDFYIGHICFENPMIET